MVYIDLNGLKQINDEQGHEAGDSFIRRAAQQIVAVFPEHTYRIGGDEFVVIYPDILQQQFEFLINQLRLNARQHHVSISCGSVWRTECMALDEMLKEADEKMYEDKKKFYEKNISKKNSIILERYLGYPLTKEMKESIMIHICAAFVRNLEYLNLLEVLIVCPGSMATGKYLEAQVKNYFDFRVAAVIPSRDVEEFLKSNKIDFVISTVNVRSESVPCVKVQAQLTMNDINAIQNIAFLLGRKENKSENESRYVEQNFLDVMKTFLEKLDASKRDEFFDEVYSLMETKIQSTGKSILAQMLDPSKIMIKQEKITWEQGILQAADILEKKGCVGSDYGKKAVENVKEYGDYIIISKGIALAHAGKKEAHVYKDGLSLVMCPEGIEFTEGNIVYLVFCFAVAEEKDYLKLFQEIIALGKTQKR